MRLKNGRLSSNNMRGFPKNLKVVSATLPQSLFTNQIPDTFNDGDFELGLRFQTKRNGKILGVRYWKVAQTRETVHQGKIWDSSGNLLSSVNFVNETASGWQYQKFLTPLSIDKDTTYTASYNVLGWFAVTRPVFVSGIRVENGDLFALDDGINGVYSASLNSFPVQTYAQSNYFADIVFQSFP